MPTTREVEAARLERMRRQAQQRAAAAASTPKPRTRAERLEAEHKALTGPRWACRLDGCPVAHIWHPAAATPIAEAEARRHYIDRHYQPEPPYALRGLTGEPTGPATRKPLGSPPTANRPTPRQRPPRSAWEERTEPTWIDRM